MNKKLTLVGILSALALVACDTTGGSSVSFDTIPPYDGPVANGVYNWTTKPDDMSQADWVDHQSELLYKMEKYAYDQHLAGIPLYDDSGLELFSPRLKLVSETYIPDYGFGINESEIDASGNMHNGQPFNTDTYPGLPASYFHSYATEDSGTFNYWNSQGQDVSGKNGMITSGYFGIQLTYDANNNPTGYEWINNLSKDARPIPLNDDGEEVVYNDGETYTKWRVHLFTAADEGSEAAAGRVFRYNISENSSYYEKYHNRGIQLEDYLTPYQAILDNALVRASGLITDSSGFLGASDYLYSTGGDRSWENVGIQLNEAEGSMDFEFVTPKTQFYAMYNLSSGLYSPLPREYLMELGGDDPTIDSDDDTAWASGCRNFGMIGTAQGGDYRTTVDRLLSTGAYVVDYWQQGSLCIYKANDLYFDKENIHFDGYTETVVASEEAAYQRFINGGLDSVTCPAEHITEHNGASYAHATEGSTIIKINLNSCTQAEWEYYFGTQGTMYQHQANQYWDVKWLMSDDDFLDGLFFSINRQSLATQMGRKAALGYLSDAYKIDPENNISYRDTEWGRLALKDYTDVNEFGYSQSMAQTLFRNALTRGIGTGNLARNTTVSIRFVWRYQATIDRIGTMVKTMIESAFSPVGQEFGVTLNVINELGGASYTDAYTKMDRGEFDLAEGAITGNMLNPLEFMSVVCTNSLSQGFTTNWGDNTAAVASVNPITYDADGDGIEEAYSFDAFYTACNGAAIVENGLNVNPASTPVDMADRCSVNNGTTTFYFNVPTTIVDQQTGEIPINWSFQYLWFFVARGTTTSGYYYDMSDNLNSWVRFNSNQCRIEVAIPTATLTQYATNLRNQVGNNYNNIVLYLQVTADFYQMDITRTQMVSTNVTAEAAGVTF